MGALNFLPLCREMSDHCCFFCLSLLHSTLKELYFRYLVEWTDYLKAIIKNGVTYKFLKIDCSQAQEAEQICLTKCIYI